MWEESQPGNGKVGQWLADKDLEGNMVKMNQIIHI